MHVLDGEHGSALHRMAGALAAHLGSKVRGEVCARRLWSLRVGVRLPADIVCLCVLIAPQLVLVQGGFGLWHAGLRRVA